ncbi:MAG TPA: hypothetical protein VMS08_02690 [Candidatus Saccharimonadia bacterium]|nr:hypothetical protein [Candidatus Saccharimonadia bacterium]
MIIHQSPFSLCGITSRSHLIRRKDKALLFKTKNLIGSKINRKGEISPYRVSDDRYGEAYIMPYRAAFGLTYAHIVETFGPPTTNGDQNKSDAEWAIKTPQGMVMLRNWKDGRNYGNTHAKDAQDILFWVAIGWHPRVLDWLADALDSPAHIISVDIPD